MKHTLYRAVTALLLVLCLLMSACTAAELPDSESGTTTTTDMPTGGATTTTTAAGADRTTTTAAGGVVPDDLATLPTYTGEPYIVIGDNTPVFDEQTTVSFEKYSALDSYGRCGVAIACIGQDLMPTEDRGSIGSVKPSGWHTVKYDIVDGKYLYNRCHLIGYQLTGENANKQNLITGTRYLNIEGMLPYENMVAAYIKETGNHVLYRVTPVYQTENDLVAHGVRMEGWSVEDDGDGICFDVYCFNVQPGITIKYLDGTSWLSDSEVVSTGAVMITTKRETTTTKKETTTTAQSVTYILNTNTKKIHKHTCRYVDDIKAENYAESGSTLSELESQGYVCCKVCF